MVVCCFGVFGFIIIVLFDSLHVWFFCCFLAIFNCVRYGICAYCCCVQVDWFCLLIVGFAVILVWFYMLCLFVVGCKCFLLLVWCME